MFIFFEFRINFQGKPAVFPNPFPYKKKRQFSLSLNNTHVFTST